ncbi:MAG: formate dehydrogenase family accessory protein FdhD [Candidatus Schekmanbacteria bacterium RBG_13_48_7]|uniref:Sulfur carrier protein FdhD n=1 Tax=Candidatus Schekmanbacteria bacterium RBG_13_48_7 TaxID=1817878 RepID=A0A1F7RW97_9BACT|nr:MAG: formate dehydrogenase family accessory protein FdhD [Candidatus Schekmanbacteria bacterium RBG_13_48_7]
MKKPDINSVTLKWVHAKRFSTGENAEQAIEENVCVVQESSVTIDVQGVETYTFLCTPIDKLALAAGFLYSEGVIDKLTDIEILKECDDDPTIIRVRLTNKVPRIGDTDRNLLIVSSCGACGSENIKKRIDALPNVGNFIKIRAGILHSVYKDLRKQQKLFEASGGTHAAAIFDENGKIVSFAEDTGRHNALDKSIGKCLLSNLGITGKGVALTSRLSLEMVGKCAVAGIEVIASVSAPTSMAIDVARNCNITLCAFVRESRATVFTHPSRITALI